MLEISPITVIRYYVKVQKIATQVYQVSCKIYPIVFPLNKFCLKKKVLNCTAAAAAALEIS